MLCYVLTVSCITSEASLTVIFKDSPFFYLLLNSHAMLSMSPVLYPLNFIVLHDRMEYHGKGKS